jgi:hypothetical protein
VALTLYKLQRLKSAHLVELYEKHPKLWRQKAQQAFEFAQQFVEPTGNRVREGDVLPLLRPVLDVSDELRGHLDDERLRQQFWYEWFGEYIIDRLWPELTKGVKKS